jgi:hypothetical protein
MADITSKYIYTYITVNNTQTNSYVICEYNNRYTLSTIIEKKDNNSKSITKRIMISTKRTKVIKNEQKRRKTKMENSRRMYGYSKDTKNTKKCKNTNKYMERYTQKPVMSTTSIKYYNNDDGHVNSNVLCTRRKSTRTGEYTWQSSRNRTERGYTGDVNAKAVCYKKSSPIAVNIQKYSTSDITEMAENNGAMDVDPEGHRVYGPYGKPIVNLTMIIIGMCKILMRCNTLDMAGSEYVKYNDVKIRVRRNECRSTRISEYMAYVYPEAVVIYTWFARSKTVSIQSSSWHKEYGE